MGEEVGGGFASVRTENRPARRPALRKNRNSAGTEAGPPEAQTPGFLTSLPVPLHSAHRRRSVVCASGKESIQQHLRDA